MFFLRRKKVKRKRGKYETQNLPSSSRIPHPRRQSMEATNCMPLKFSLPMHHQNIRKLPYHLFLLKNYMAVKFD